MRGLDILETELKGTRVSHLTNYTINTRFIHSQPPHLHYFVVSNSDIYQ